MDKQPFTDQDLKNWAKFLAICAAVLLLLYFIVPEDDRACILFFLGLLWRDMLESSMWDYRLRCDF